MTKKQANIQASPPKPIIAPFWRLALALAPLHRWQRKYLDTLHDVWLKGAPDPRSNIRNPKGYDPRHPQMGNYEARIVFPTLLATWITDVANERGIPGAEFNRIVERLKRG